MRVSIIFIALTLSLQIRAQKEANIWYFGGQAGLDFNYRPPKPLLNSLSGRYEGNGCFSDFKGKLLYYTNGENVWDSINKLIKNGSGLLGANSATQASIILKHPKGVAFYVFTNDEISWDTSKFCLNIINNDSISTKNKVLQYYGSEKLNAVNHLNNSDIWVSSYKANDNELIFYLLKKDGLIDCPIIRKNPKLALDYSSSLGQMKFSSNGKVIGINFGNNFNSLLCLFNNESGIIEKSFLIKSQNPYSIEFSKNNKYIYIIDRKSVLSQYDIGKFDSVHCIKSAKTIYQFKNNDIYGMQIGSDGKIYIAQPSSNYLAVINFPDSISSKSEYKDSGIYLGGRKSLWGLPNFNQSYFYTPSIDYSYEQDCRTNTITFEGKDTIKATSYKWVFSKGIISDTKATKEASYTFIDTGKWQVKYIASNGTRSDTVTKTITIRPKLARGFLGEINYCNINPLPLTLHAPKDLHCVHWYDSSMNEISKTDSLKVTKEGTYYCKATNLSFCVEWDTIKIVKSAPKANFKTSDVCESDSVVFINTSGNTNNYTWKFGDLKTSTSESPKHKYQITTSTTYNVTLIAKTEGCIDSITKPVTVNQNPSSDFTFNQTVNTFELKANKSGLVKYKWTFGTTDSITKTIETHKHIAKSKDQERICLTVADLLGCTSQTCTTATIGIQSPLNANEIKIYPNPSKGKLTIEISKAGNFTVKVYNEAGQLMLDKIIKGNQTNNILLNQAKGNYMVEIIDNECRRMNKKVVIE